MTRKSRGQRLAEATQLQAAYDAAGLSQDRSYLFIRDMAVRLARRDITGGQKKYLDSLITQGVPQLQNVERCAEIDAAIATPGMGHMSDPLTDFKFKLSKGWNLSEKQEKFLASLLTQAATLQAHGMPALTPEQLVRLESMFRIAKSRGGWFWQHRPGQARAVDNAQTCYADHGSIPADTYGRLEHIFRGPIKKMDSPRLPSGSLAYTRGAAVVVVTDPYIDEHGRLVQDVLQNSDMVTALEDSLSKRAPKAQKES
jgi:hypothetical protein